MERKDIAISEIVGRTMVRVERQGAEVYFHTTSGRRFVMAHEQDCCESVYIDSITGNLEDLVGSPILVAEESKSHESPKSEKPDSFTWTFYKFATVKGWVDIRWYGESNGYYSESVGVAEYISTWQENPLFGRH